MNSLNHVYFLKLTIIRVMFDLSCRQAEEEWNKTGV